MIDLIYPIFFSCQCCIASAFWVSKIILLQFRALGLRWIQIIIYGMLYFYFVICIIDNFLVKENSFIFESVEKRKIRGRYTIIGADPDKIWEFKKKKIHIIENNKKRIVKGSPYTFLRRLIENFNFPLPKKLPPLC